VNDPGSIGDATHMNFLSVCSGIEAASVAWNPLGWKAWAFSEIEKHPCATLAHHYPDVPNLGDMTQFETWPHPHEPIDLLCGGTPCQSFSVAGLRKGLDDERGNLMLTFARIAAKYRPRWLVWENVPGVLSSNDGRDFASFLGLITGQRIDPPREGWQTFGIVPGYRNAYGAAWRTLDAQYFGLAQRRKRVFVIGYLGDWRRAATVLLERHSLQGHPAPRREAREALTDNVGNGAQSRLRQSRDYSGLDCAETFEEDPAIAEASAAVVGTLGVRTGRSIGAQDATCGHLIASTLQSVAPTLDAHYGDKQGLDNQHIDGGAGLFVTHTLRGNGFDASEDGTGRGVPLVLTAYRNAGDGCAYEEGDITAPLTTGTDQCAQIVAYNVCFNDANGVRPDRPNGGLYVTEAITAPTLTQAPIDTKIVERAMAVRRLTPRECERLQGFPDDYTIVPSYQGWRPMDKDETPESCRELGLTARQSKTTGKWRVKDADGPRYKALGNSWAVPCARWIGERIAAVDAIPQAAATH
jgi:DNA (cytosine-5)-methyltransferase 1